MLVLSLALALQVTVQADSGQVSAGVRVSPYRRIPVTEEHRRTAFKDAGARAMVLHARTARAQQDSSLLSYQVKSYQRVSVGMSIRETARSRLAFRQESAARVRWQRGVGAHVEVLGGRVAAPIIGGIDDAEKEMKDEIESEIGDMLAVPYYPGKDELWFMEMFEADQDSANGDDGPILIHPIAEGSEAYFTFSSGDSVIIALSDGRRITLREIIATPRMARWNLVVASIWFETDDAHIVRAAMRFSSPMDIWQTVEEEERAERDSTDDDVPPLVKAMMTPMRAEITAITIEYGLFEERFWLPRTQAAEGHARVSFMRVPFSVEQRYTYESVNAALDLTAIARPTDLINSDSLRGALYAAGLDTAAVRDSVTRTFAIRDSIRVVNRAARCATHDTYTLYEQNQNGRLPMEIAMPCDRAKLENSPDLPPSIYDSGEELFGAAERDELMRALDFGLQSAWAPQPPHLEYGVPYTRFNRIEGFSSGLSVSSNLGRGYTVGVIGRASVADLQLNGELDVTRSNGRRAIRGAVYRRLVASTDFGDPLSFGASIPNFFYAQDEGFYHRTWGAEIAAESNPRGGFEWRAFAEQQWSATVENEWSLFGGAHDDRYLPNLTADKGWYYGGAVRWRGGRGLDPKGWRWSNDLRLEGATGELEYGRYFVESTVSRGLGPVAASLTGAAGYSSGDLPAQRSFFLGGLHSVRGQRADAGAGDAFWLGRFELGANITAAKPVIFADFGWAGARDTWREVGRPMSGVGVGASFLDGLIRVDLARGMYPVWRTRLNLYLEARF